MNAGYKKRALIVWTNYKRLYNFVVGQCFKSTCDFISVTMVTPKVHKQAFKVSVFVNYLKNQVYDLLFLLFVGKLTKFFNFSDSMTKSCLADFKIQREEASYSL